MTERRCPNVNCGLPIRDCPCGFCHGKPVGDGRSLVDGKSRPSLACPRCGQTAASGRSQTQGEAYNALAEVAALDGAPDERR